MKLHLWGMTLFLLGIGYGHAFTTRNALIGVVCILGVMILQHSRPKVF